MRFSHFGPETPPAPPSAPRTFARGPHAADGGAGSERRSRASSSLPEAEFSTAGGINLPKIVYCYSEDGRRHKQLVKGRDDMRGDAIMQQVLGLFHELLQRDP